MITQWQLYLYSYWLNREYTEDTVVQCYTIQTCLHSKETRIAVGTVQSACKMLPVHLC